MEWNNLHSTLVDSSKLIVDEYKRNLISKGKVATGSLLNTLRAEAISTEDSEDIDLHLQHYWKYVEFGRNPGKFPPVDAIKAWIADKKLPVDNINSAAYLISRKIALKGIPATHSLQESLNRLPLENEINIAIDKDIEKFIDEYYAKDKE